MSFFKKPKFRSKKYTNWVATLNCARCHIRDETVIPHHLIGVGDGIMGGKAGDDLAVPLCFRCHQYIHSPESNKNEQWDWVKRTQEKAKKEGFNFK